MKNELRVSYKTLPSIEKLDPTIAETFDSHQLLTLLFGSPLFTYGNHVEKIYALNVVPDDHFRIWRIEFPEGQRFSDGSLLTAEHWYHSVARSILFGRGVHFNPKRLLLGAEEADTGYCDGLRMSGKNVVELELKVANKNFSKLLGKVEAAILPINSSDIRGSKICSLPVSGAYQIIRADSQQIELAANAHFPGHQGRPVFEKIVISQHSEEEAFTEFSKGNIDLISLSSEPNQKTSKLLPADMQVLRDFGQTYFLSFRPRNKNSPSAFSTTEKEFFENRKALARSMEAHHILDSFSEQRTVLMGQGLGRIEAAPVLETEKSVSNVPAFSIALVESEIGRYVYKFLKQAGYRIDPIWVDGFGKLFSGDAIRSDVFLAWNDFCGFDPYVSLHNALNPDRSLFLDEEEFYVRLSTIQDLENSSQKDAAYKKLHLELLERIALIPFLGKWFSTYASADVDIKSMIGGVLWTAGRLQV